MFLEEVDETSAKVENGAADAVLEAKSNSEDVP